MLHLHYRVSIKSQTKPRFHGEMSFPRPTPKLEDHTLSAVRHFSFNILAATAQTPHAACNAEMLSAPM